MWPCNVMGCCPEVVGHHCYSLCEPPTPTTSRSLGCLTTYTLSLTNAGFTKAGPVLGLLDNCTSVLGVCADARHQWLSVTSQMRSGCTCEGSYMKEQQS